MFSILIFKAHDCWIYLLVLASSLTLPFLLSPFQIIKGGDWGCRVHGRALTWSHSCQHRQRVVCERHAGGPRLGSQGVEIKLPRLLKWTRRGQSWQKKWDQQKKWREEGGKERGGFNQQNVAYLIGYTKKIYLIRIEGELSNLKFLWIRLIDASFVYWLIAVHCSLFLTFRYSLLTGSRFESGDSVHDAIRKHKDINRN